MSFWVESHLRAGVLEVGALLLLPAAVLPLPLRCWLPLLAARRARLRRVEAARQVAVAARLRAPMSVA